MVKYIYKQLDLCDEWDDAPSSFSERLRKECVSLKNYKRNNFDYYKLDDKLVQEIQARWRNQFDSFGYPLPLDNNKKKNY